MIDFETRQLANGIAVVNVTGSLDELNRSYFFDCVSDLIEEGFVQIVVDCTGLGHISSSGLAGLLRARSQAQSKGGKIYLTHLDSAVADVLTLTRINMLLAICPTTGELLERLIPESAGVVSAESEI